MGALTMGWVGWNAVGWLIKPGGEGGPRELVAVGMLWR